jgi:hypothetical protein
MSVGILIHLLIIVIILALVWWALSAIPLPHPFGIIVRIVFVLICVLILLGMLGTETGGAYLRW